MILDKRKARKTILDFHAFLVFIIYFNLRTLFFGGGSYPFGSMNYIWVEVG
jgi:hypothetical protein